MVCDSIPLLCSSPARTAELSYKKKRGWGEASSAAIPPNLPHPHHCKMASSRINPNDNAGNNNNNNNDYDNVAVNEEFTPDNIMELRNDAYRRLVPFRDHPACPTEGELRRMGTMQLRAMMEEFEIGLFDEVRRNAFACREEESERNHRGSYYHIDRWRRHNMSFSTSSYRRSHGG